MTSQVTVIGIDVAKETLSLCDARTGEVFELPNEARAIKAWLKTLLHRPTHSIPCRSAPCARIAGKARYRLAVATVSGPTAYNCSRLYAATPMPQGFLMFS